MQEITGRPSLEVFTFAGRVTLVKLLSEAARLAADHGAVDWLDQMATSFSGVALLIKSSADCFTPPFKK
jgi:hypothetical protein